MTGRRGALAAYDGGGTILPVSISPQVEALTKSDALSPRCASQAPAGILSEMSRCHGPIMSSKSQSDAGTFQWPQPGESHLIIHSAWLLSVQSFWQLLSSELCETIPDWTKL